MRTLFSDEPYSFQEEVKNPATFLNFSIPDGDYALPYQNISKISLNDTAEHQLITIEFGRVATIEIKGINMRHIYAFLLNRNIRSLQCGIYKDSLIDGDDKTLTISNINVVFTETEK